MATGGPSGGHSYHGFGDDMWSDSDEEVEETQDALELRRLLMACYKSMGGHEWRLKKGWDTPYDIWLWEGLTFNKEFQLIEFRLPNNNLTGKIPNEITQFKHLRVVDFSHNYIEGSGDYESAITGEEYAIPKEIGNMLSLEEWCLQNNYLKGAKKNMFRQSHNKCIFFNR
jgi:hypothetical protein